MATAGFGDVLAGDFAARRLGHRSMTASDIIQHLGEAFLDLREHREKIFPG